MIPASFTAANSEVKFADGQNSKSKGIQLQNQ